MGGAASSQPEASPCAKATAGVWGLPPGDGAGARKRLLLLPARAPAGPDPRALLAAKKGRASKKFGTPGVPAVSFLLANGKLADFVHCRPGLVECIVDGIWHASYPRIDCKIVRKDDLAVPRSSSPPSTRKHSSSPGKKSNRRPAGKIFFGPKSGERGAEKTFEGQQRKGRAVGPDLFRSAAGRAARLRAVVEGGEGGGGGVVPAVTGKRLLGLLNRLADLCRDAQVPSNLSGFATGEDTAVNAGLRTEGQACLDCGLSFHAAFLSCSITGRLHRGPAWGAAVSLPKGRKKAAPEEGGCDSPETIGRSSSFHAEPEGAAVDASIARGEYAQFECESGDALAVLVACGKIEIYSPNLQWMYGAQRLAAHVKKGTVQAMSFGTGTYHLPIAGVTRSSWEALAALADKAGVHHNIWEQIRTRKSAMARLLSPSRGPFFASARSPPGLYVHVHRQVPVFICKACTFGNSAGSACRMCGALREDNDVWSLPFKAGELGALFGPGSPKTPSSPKSGRPARPACDWRESPPPLATSCRLASRGGSRCASPTNASLGLPDDRAFSWSVSRDSMGSPCLAVSCDNPVQPGSPATPKNSCCLTSRGGSCFASPTNASPTLPDDRAFSWSVSRDSMGSPCLAVSCDNPVQPGSPATPENSCCLTSRGGSCFASPTNASPTLPDDRAFSWSVSRDSMGSPCVPFSCDSPVQPGSPATPKNSSAKCIVTPRKPSAFEGSAAAALAAVGAFTPSTPKNPSSGCIATPRKLPPSDGGAAGVSLSASSSQDGGERVSGSDGARGSLLSPLPVRRQSRGSFAAPRKLSPSDEGAAGVSPSESSPGPCTGRPSGSAGTAVDRISLPTRRRSCSSQDRQTSPRESFSGEGSDDLPAPPLSRPPRGGQASPCNSGCSREDSEDEGSADAAAFAAHATGVCGLEGAHRRTSPGRLSPLPAVGSPGAGCVHRLPLMNRRTSGAEPLSATCADPVAEQEDHRRSQDTRMIYPVSTPADWEQQHPYSAEDRAQGAEYSQSPSQPVGELGSRSPRRAHEKSTQHQQFRQGPSVGSALTKEGATLPPQPQQQKQPPKPEGAAEAEARPAPPGLGRKRCCTECRRRHCNTVLMPCKHLGACTACAARLTHCPLCTSPVTHRLDVYA
ncbi:RING finger protein B [Diplonema papillatum]|nr:RING finger protein B [Diplonema papillatum]